MPVAGFGKFPPLENRHLWAWLLGGKWEAKFNLIRDCYYSLPLPIKSLFSFNTEKLVYERLGIIVAEFLGLSNSMAVSSFFNDGKKAIICIFEVSNRNTCYKILLHELAHTLDPHEYNNISRFPQNYFPDWLYKVANVSKWQDILKQEPESTEKFDLSPKEISSHHLRWMSKPKEQWACRLAITLAIDYLVPAGLVKSDDILMSGGGMSLVQFLLFYPKSYSYFHNYIRMILEHAPK